jgi:hypothetical protein
MRWSIALASAAMLALGLAAASRATTGFAFSTNTPDGKMGMASRPASAGKLEIEAGDDFVLAGATSLTSATFTGLLPTATLLTSVSQVSVEIYRVFPNDSDTTRTSGPPDNSTAQVPTRNNSPSDVAFTSRDLSAGTLVSTATVISPAFTVANSVGAGGIHPIPGQTTGGDGPVTGEEVQFSVVFSPTIDLPAGHYFFVPQVELAGSGDFYWLSAPRPIVSPGTPFTPDLQAWTRDEFLAPDWLRIGTDIVGSGAFNGTFSLAGTMATDVTPPRCSLVAVVPGPPKQIEIEVQDTGSGLGSVVVTAAENANVPVPAFAPGTTSPLMITATKADQSKGSTVALTVTDVAGNTTTCDPSWPAARVRHRHHSPKP